MQRFWDHVFWGNTVSDYLTAIGIFFGLLLIIYILKTIIFSRIKRWGLKKSSFLVENISTGIRRTILPLLLYGSLYTAVMALKLRADFEKTFHIISVIVLTFFLIRILVSILKFSLNSYLRAKGEPDFRQRQLNGIVTVGSFVIWVTGFLFLLDNLGFKISTVITGLGIGGIAIALAAQAILGDLFNYFVIFFDRPFEIGDFITVDEKMGTVEYIGIKSTRIRSLSGEQIIFSNSNLTAARVHNFKRLKKRRVVFKLSLVFGTTSAQLESVPGLIKEIIDGITDTTFDRSHFTSIGEFSFIFENVYFINTPNYNRFMDIQQEINLKLLKKLEEKKIELAYPTRTINRNEGGRD